MTAAYLSAGHIVYPVGTCNSEGELCRIFKKGEIPTQIDDLGELQYLRGLVHRAKIGNIKELRRLRLLRRTIRNELVRGRRVRIRLKFQV